MNDSTRADAEAAEREVRSLEWEGKAARAVITRRAYGTGIEDLWDAIVKPERLKRWFLPVSGDLREGGTYQLEGNAGGKIKRCEAPRLLAVTWEINNGVGWVNVNLDPIDDGKTRLVLEHIAHEDAAFLGFWEQFGPGAVGVGWDLGLAALADYVKTSGGTFAAEQDAWLKTDDGRASFRSAAMDG